MLAGIDSKFHIEQTNSRKVSLPDLSISAIIHEGSQRAQKRSNARMWSLTFIKDRKHRLLKGSDFDVKVGKQLNRSHRACRIIDCESAQRGMAFGRCGGLTTMVNVDIIESAIERVNIALREIQQIKNIQTHFLLQTSRGNDESPAWKVSHLIMYLSSYLVVGHKRPLRENAPHIDRKLERFALKK